MVDLGRPRPGRLLARLGQERRELLDGVSNTGVAFMKRHCGGAAAGRPFARSDRRARVPAFDRLFNLAHRAGVMRQLPVQSDSRCQAVFAEAAEEVLADVGRAAAERAWQQSWLGQSGTSPSVNRSMKALSSGETSRGSSFSRPSHTSWGQLACLAHCSAVRRLRSRWARIFWPLVVMSRPVVLGSSPPI